MKKKDSTKNIIEEHSPIEYFKDLVEDAIENQQAQIDEMEEFYVVNLLAEHVRSDNAYVNMENASREEPLATMLCRTLQAEYDEERMKQFKKLGDFTLFISGYFSESLNKKIIDADYYKVIGESAYSNLSCLMKRKKQGDLFFNLFKNLADRFQSLVDIIAEVSDKSFVNSDKGVLKIYERWVKSGAGKDAELLKEKGIIPVFQESTYLQ